MAKAKRRDAEDQGLSPEEIQKLYPEFRRDMIVRMNDIIDRTHVNRENVDEQILTSPGDIGDAAVVDTSADYFMKLTTNLQRELLEIGDALERMQRGTYGICVSCSEPINIERLRTLPYARMCIDCQSAAEARPMRATDPTPSL